MFWREVEGFVFGIEERRKINFPTVSSALERRSLLVRWSAINTNSNSLPTSSISTTMSSIQFVNSVESGRTKANNSLGESESKSRNFYDHDYASGPRKKKYEES